MAFERIRAAADRFKRTFGSTDFDDAEWLVYLKDFDLRTRWTNAQLSHMDIAKELPPAFTAYRVSAILNRVDEIMLLRDELGYPPVPPVPIRHLREVKRIQRAYAKKQVALAA